MIHIKGDLTYYYEYALIYINNVYTGSACRPQSHYGSYYNCGTFPAASGSVTIRVRGTSDVSSMQVRIDFVGNLRGSKVHISYFYQSNDRNKIFAILKNDGSFF